MSVSVIVGGQYGSEAKGHVTDQAMRFIQHTWPGDTVLNIRVGGPNAGHTVYDENGNKFPLRQIPVGAIQPNVQVAIGPGSEIDLEVLISEFEMLAQAGHHLTVWIHSEVTLLTVAHKDREAAAHLSRDIGSTGKGIGAARAERIMRKAQTIRQHIEVHAPDLTKVNTMFGFPIKILSPVEWTDLVNKTALNGHVVIEGVQGYGLGLHAGHYPQSTTSDATAVDFMSMAGVSPWAAQADPNIYVVAREYPIRVAGNSGPMYAETTWEELGLPEEKTTVTQKVRRVGQWDADLIRAAVEANGGSPRAALVVTMVDQVFPDLAGFAANNWHEAEAYLGPTHPVWAHLAKIAEDAGTGVLGFTTSPTTIVWM